MNALSNRWPMSAPVSITTSSATCLLYTSICALCEDEDSEVSDLARELYYSSLWLQELVEWYQSRRQEQENYEEEYEQYHGFDMTMM